MKLINKLLKKLRIIKLELKEDNNLSFNYINNKKLNTDLGNDIWENRCKVKE